MTSQHCPQDWPISTDGTVDYHEELLACLSRINTYKPPVQTCSTGWSFSGFYRGPTSIAYLFYRISEIYPDLEFKQQSLLEWAEAYLQLSRHVTKQSPIPSHCGIANETLAYTALSAVINDDASLVKQLCDFSRIINETHDDGSNEWLCGRAGYLYLLRMCRAHFGQKNVRATSMLSTIIGRTMRRIMQEPEQGQWYSQNHLGAANGLVGILCQLVLSDPENAFKTCESILPGLFEAKFRCRRVLSLSSAPHDDLVEFCHGEPGFVLSLRSIRNHLTTLDAVPLRDQIDEAMKLAQEDIVRDGLLMKAPCLCHGIAGQFLALEDEADAQRSLACMRSKVLEGNTDWMVKVGQGDTFSSLFEGEAGRAWIWAIADKKLEKNCIGFNDL